MNKFFKLVNFVFEVIIKLFLENLGVFFVKFLFWYFFNCNLVCFWLFINLFLLIFFKLFKLECKYCRVWLFNKNFLGFLLGFFIGNRFCFRDFWVYVFFFNWVVEILKFCWFFVVVINLLFDFLLIFSFLNKLFRDFRILGLFKLFLFFEVFNFNFGIIGILFFIVKDWFW